MTKRVHFTVSLELPSGASVADMQAYIHMEICAGAGGLRPEDPIFELDRRAVEVKAADSTSAFLVYVKEQNSPVIGAFSSAANARAAIRKLHESTGRNIHDFFVERLKLDEFIH